MTTFRKHLERHRTDRIGWLRDDKVATQLMKQDALGAHARDELGISEAFSGQPIQLAARVGGASPLMGAWRVMFWGALAMGITAGVGALFGAAAGG